MRKLLIPIVLILIGVYISSVYVIEEGTRGVVLRFNKIIGLSEPGLHFKIPGMDTVKVIDAKIQTTNSSNNNKEQRFFNVQKKELIVDYFVQWKIIDFNRYYETVAGGNNVEDLLLARLNGRLRAEIGKLSNKDIINDSNADTQSRNSLMNRVKDALNGGVQEVTENVSSDEHKEIESNKTSLRAFGVEVIDVRIKQINFPAEVSGSIYARMRAEREVIARDKRFEGVRKAEETRAEATLQETKILSEAERQSRAIRGEGDAIAAKLYADAFGKDREFFSFIRSLKAYEQSFSGNDVMVISPDSEFFQYMKLKSNN
ncbi:MULTISPECIES: protease modulator HflC [unclassified Gilliamella]|uniref:protease modulator HflC n=1 Tax=unclassified Gilliamella TaxID=2685620 RepID=UPI00226AC560|nr:MULTISPECIES: protease modulator HflC [unclassified Gilliamella]MCX8574407.1 protease modulator HflC [Gilliamella sp. B3831]MCX8576638.1 protease modulator HflC [Gilliamella sp. B3815]MCX8579280.1 protease modulator HflC [Gilliamella sp. B2717]MCX8589083.1 protease modulator HflC [Gilliamella sp. B3801]MCX8590792.1 protease modulator HflC [Gilliamella sp. B3812]